VTLFNFY